MTLSLQCPSCGSKVRGPDNLAGRKVKCPKCGSSFFVPHSFSSDEGGKLSGCQPGRTSSPSSGPGRIPSPPVVPHATKQPMPEAMGSVQNPGSADFTRPSAGKKRRKERGLFLGFLQEFKEGFQEGLVDSKETGALPPASAHGQNSRDTERVHRSSKPPVAASTETPTEQRRPIIIDDPRFPGRRSFLLTTLLGGAIFGVGMGALAGFGRPVARLNQARRRPLPSKLTPFQQSCMEMSPSENE
jgi:hypothetical protein